MRALIPNSTQIPDVILDHWMARLSGAEFKVVLYIARRTYGFGKESDTISINQLSTGIKKRDGNQLDYGTGLSRSSVKAACASLVASGILIKTQATVGASNEPDQNTYRLNLYAAMQEEGNEGGAGSEGEVLGSNHEVGQNLAHVGQKSAHLEKASKEVGQKLAQVGQKTTQVGQESPYGRPETGPGVGQFLAPQETDQETEEQETATTARSSAREQEPASAVAADSPSAIPEGAGAEVAKLLMDVGFSSRDATTLAAANPPEVIRQQIEWLASRSVKKNRLGMLRRSIEERWPKPETDEETKKQETAQATEARQSAKETRRQEIVSGLRSMYARLESDAPEAFEAFLDHIEQKKAQEATRPLISQSPKRLAAVLAAYDDEQHRIGLMVEFFKSREVPLPEYAPLLSSLSDPRAAPLDQLFASAT